MYGREKGALEKMQEEIDDLKRTVYLLIEAVHELSHGNTADCRVAVGDAEKSIPLSEASKKEIDKRYECWSHDGD